MPSDSPRAALFKRCLPRRRGGVTRKSFRLALDRRKSAFIDKSQQFSSNKTINL
jgi:hypothetical protein